MELLMKNGPGNCLNVYSNFDGTITLSNNLTKEKMDIKIDFGKNLVRYKWDTIAMGEMSYKVINLSKF